MKEPKQQILIGDRQLIQVEDLSKAAAAQAIEAIERKDDKAARLQIYCAHIQSPYGNENMGDLIAEVDEFFQAYKNRWTK